MSSETLKQWISHNEKNLMVMDETAIRFYIKTILESKPTLRNKIKLLCMYTMLCDFQVQIEGDMLSSFNRYIMFGGSGENMKKSSSKQNDD